METHGEQARVRRCGRALRRFLITASAIVILIIALTTWIGGNMREAMAALASARIRAVSAKAMNDAILDTMESNSAYTALLHIRENGTKVYMVQADPQQMNLLAAQCAEAAQERIAALGEQGISIPIGTITGLTFLSGKGPSIHISFTPAGSVQSQFSSEFTSSGINQTLYRVNLKLTASVQLVMPGVYQSISVTAEAAIAENIIVGEVPEVYTNVASEEDMLNLIPTEVP